MSRLGWCLAACACNGGDPWDDVGPAQPGSLRVELGAIDGLAVEDAVVGLDAIDVDRCKARPSHTLLGGAWWVVPPMPVLLEGGPWCGLSVQFLGALEFAGPGASFVGELELPDLDLVVDRDLAVDGDAFVLRLGDDGWLTEADLEEGLITPAHPAHDRVVRRLVGAAAVYRDDDDGALTDDELARGPLTAD